MKTALGDKTARGLVPSQAALGSRGGLRIARAVTVTAPSSD
jgi:hypothetical protein